MKYGIDLGSRTVKIAGISKKKVTFNRIFDTVTFYTNYGISHKGKFQIDLKKLGIKTKQLVSTGYGRNSLVSADKTTEIIAHAKGAIWQTGKKNFTLLDIGGQDNKIILVKKGIVSDFKINDRCAAGCGKYLENMCHTLNMPLETLSSHYKNPIELHSTCTVFAETELIGRMAEGISLNRLASGVNYSVFSRIKTDLISLYKGDPIIFVGGTAQNKALKKFIERDLKTPIIIPNYPQLNGAIGCAV